MSLRDEILGIQDCGERVVYVPQWKCKVLVKAFTAASRYDMVAGCTTVKDGKADVDGKKLLAMTVIESAHDPKTGDKLFTVADIGTLLAKSYGALETIAQAANELSGIGADAQEDAEKN
jgi:hypothetical protein